jgi:hypothetical protein
LIVRSQALSSCCGWWLNRFPIFNTHHVSFPSIVTNIESA